MSAAGALDSRVEEKLNARVPRPSPGFARAIALAAIRETFEETGLAIGVSDYGAPEDPPSRRLDPVRRDGRLSSARRHRLSRPRDHAARPPQALRRALSRRSTRAPSPGASRASSIRKPNSSISSGRRSTKRARWTCPTSPVSRSTISSRRWKAVSTAAGRGPSIASCAASACVRSCSELMPHARPGSEPSGELDQGEMIGPGGAVRAVVAADDDVEQFDHDLAVDYRQMIEREAAMFERGNQRLALGVEAGHVAVDERPPYPGVQARQSARQPIVAKKLRIGGKEPVEYERLGPLLQTVEALGRVGRRHGGDPLRLLPDANPAVMQSESSLTLIRHG